MRSQAKTTWGYGLGSMARIGDSVFGFYLIYYLSTVAGVDPALAGVIGGSGLLVGALAGPLIGFLSDRSRSRFGRRRPFMVANVIPCMVLLTLLFTKVDLGTASGIFYGVVAILFAITYYGYLIPYDALGSALTTDYNQRTTIRSICTAILYVTVLVGGTVVVQVQVALTQWMSVESAWSLAVLLTASIPGALFGLVAWWATRGHEAPVAPVATGRSIDRRSIRSALMIFTLRPVWAILLWGVIYFFANALMASTVIYFGVYVLELSESLASLLFVVAAVATIVMIVPGNLLAKKLGKRNAILAGLAFFAVVSVVTLIVGFHGFITGVILMAAFSVCNSIALSCSYAMIYDLREVTELRLGDDKTAVILGWFNLTIGVGGSLAAVVTGAVLQGAGFDPAAAASDAVRNAIIALQVWVPALILVASGFVLLLWKLDARAHAAATAEIEVRTRASQVDDPDSIATR